MAPGMEARWMPVRMASVGAASLFSTRSTAGADEGRLGLLQPASRAATAQPNTTAHGRRARRRYGATLARLSGSRWLKGSRLMSWALPLVSMGVSDFQTKVFGMR